MNKRARIIGVIVTTVALAGGTAFALAQQTAPDTDTELAEEQYGNNAICPEGRVEAKGEWEQAVEHLSSMGDEVGVEDIPAVDILWVAPDDPATYVDSPDQLSLGTVVVGCVDVGGGELRRIDEDYLIFGNGGDE
jgi:hypothetical protein